MDQKNWKGIKTIAVATLLIAALCVVAMPVQAKTYYTFDGHPAVRYENSDIESRLRPYVDHVEYDLKSNVGHGYGCRLYLTEAGKEAFRMRSSSVMGGVTNAVMTAPEWKQQRSYMSVATEIYMHAEWDRTTVHIEYNYADLKWWEEPYRRM